MNKEKIILTSSRSADGLDVLISHIESRGYSVVLASTLEELEQQDFGQAFSILSDRTTYLIPEHVYSRATGFSINIHPSLLPLHAGSYSLFWSCIFDDPYGITIHELGPKLDQGSILFQSAIEYSACQTFRDVYRATRIATVAAIDVLLQANDLKFKFCGIASSKENFFLHTSSVARPLLERLPNSWDTSIATAREILRGSTDKSGRTI